MMAKRAPKTPSPLEAWEQKALVRWMAARRIEFFSVPNEGKRGPRLAAHMKALGMRHGVPDIIIVSPVPAYPDMRLALEMKRADGTSRDLTQHQQDMHEVMQRCGWSILVCFGHEQAITRLTELGFGP
jgi:hypothetical protein